MPAIAARRGSTEPIFTEAPPSPPPQADEVLCETLQLGVCGTDREILHSAQPWTPPGENELILGHECLARVVATGAKVTRLRVGDLVVPVVRRATPSGNEGSDSPAARFGRVDMLPFGNLFVERGIYKEHGFSAAQWLDRPEFLYPVPADIVPIAVFAEPLAVAEKGANEALAIQRGRMHAKVWTEPPPRVLVTGLGPIAFAAAIACIARSWPVTLWGRDASDTFRARLARDFGASYLGGELAAPEALHIERDGYDLVLECTGSDEVMLLAAPMIRSCGVMVWLGSLRVPLPNQHNVARLMRDALVRNHAYVGCVNAAPRDFADALAHLQQLYGPLQRQFDALLTARVKPVDALWHYSHRQPQGIKTVVEFA